MPSLCVFLFQNALQLQLQALRFSHEVQLQQKKDEAETLTAQVDKLQEQVQGM